MIIIGSASRTLIAGAGRVPRPGRRPNPDRARLGRGLLHRGRSHGVCAFRTGTGEFELGYSRLGLGEVHTVYPQQDLVTDLVGEYLDRGGDIRFGVAVTGVDPRTATVGYRDATGGGVLTSRFLAGCDGGNGVTRAAVPAAPGRRHGGDHYLVTAGCALFAVRQARW